MSTQSLPTGMKHDQKDPHKQRYVQKTPHKQLADQRAYMPIRRRSTSELASWLPGWQNYIHEICLALN